MRVPGTGKLRERRDLDAARAGNGEDAGGQPLRAASRAARASGRDIAGKRLTSPPARDRRGDISCARISGRWERRTGGALGIAQLVGARLRLRCLYGGVSI
jgi:hypothetical protein